jgi:toxin ParE1/3/4
MTSRGNSGTTSSLWNQNLRVWPVAGFETLRIYYLGLDDAIVIIRILHSKRNVRRILESERV